MPCCQIDKTNYYYELHGEGHPIVLISGYGCDHTYWQFVYPALAKYFQVLLLDNRGTGQTQDDGSTLTSSTMADEVVMLFKALGLSQPHIVGQSMGGTIAQMVAIRHGNDIDKLCILDSTARWRKPMLIGFQTYIKLLEQGLIDDAINLSFALCNGESFLRDETRVSAFLQRIKNNPYPQALTDTKRHQSVLEEHDSTKQLNKIDNETLVLAAKEDAIALNCDTEAMAKGIKNAILKIITGGHSSCNEEPQQVIDSLLAFLKR